MEVNNFSPCQPLVNKQQKYNSKPAFGMIRVTVKPEVVSHYGESTLPRVMEFVKAVRLSNLNPLTWFKNRRVIVHLGDEMGRTELALTVNEGKYITKNRCGCGLHLPSAYDNIIKEIKSDKKAVKRAAEIQRENKQYFKQQADLANACIKEFGKKV